MIRSIIRSEQGSMALEASILAPALLLLVGVLILAGRVSLAHQSLEEAAAQAARAASISRTTTQADGASQAAARTYLAGTAMHCQQVSVTNTVEAVAKAAGTPATVTSTVTCTISTGDLLIPGLSGTRTITATATSAVDTYRQAQ